jgi:hypothetical protein
MGLGRGVVITVATSLLVSGVVAAADYFMGPGDKPAVARPASLASGAAIDMPAVGMPAVDTSAAADTRGAVGAIPSGPAAMQAAESEALAVNPSFQAISKEMNFPDLAKDLARYRDSLPDAGALLQRGVPADLERQIGLPR